MLVMIQESMLVMIQESMLVMIQESMLVMTQESMLVMIQESMLVMAHESTLVWAMRAWVMHGVTILGLRAPPPPAPGVLLCRVTVSGDIPPPPHQPHSQPFLGLPFHELFSSSLQFCTQPFKDMNLALLRVSYLGLSRGGSSAPALEP